jgi:hypothetical protein
VVTGSIHVLYAPELLRKTIPTWFRNMGHVGLSRRKQMAKTEVRDVYIQGRFHSTHSVEICSICGGHRPVTKKVADGECLGHPGVKNYLLPLGETHPQRKREPKKVVKDVPAT